MRLSWSGAASRFTITFYLWYNKRKLAPPFANFNYTDFYSNVHYIVFILHNNLFMLKLKGDPLWT